MSDHIALRLRCGRGLAIVVAVWYLPAHAQSTDYKFDVFKSSPEYSDTLVAKNASGAKLFQRQSSNNVLTCLLVEGSRRSIISDPKGELTRCTGLGSNGGVVGWYKKSGELPPYTGFAYLNGQYADVVPDATNPVWGNTINAVSPNGLMAGTYLAQDGSYLIFLTYGSSYNYIQISGVNTLIATGVNDRGILVAQEFFDTLWGEEINSVIIADDVASAISFPGANSTYANNINDRGDVAGYYYDTQNVQHGFIYSSSKNAYFGPIDVVGAAATSLTGITNRDVVTGYALFPGASNSSAVIGFPIMALVKKAK